MHKVSRRRLIHLAAGGLVLLARRSFAATGSFDQSGFVQIGGIDQWIAIQGRDARNPVILYLHGGPAEAQSPFLKEFLPWEQDFTVVNWDQRGSGKTYGKNGPTTPDMTLNRMASDAIEIAEYANKRLAKRKAILVGQSWGAMLGLTVIKRRPDLFYAFVGTGQPVNWTLSLEDRERWARRLATAAGDSSALKELDDAGKLSPTDVKRVMASRKWLMSPSDVSYLNIQKTFLGSPPYPTKGEVADWIAGSQFTAPKLYQTTMAFDARKVGLEMPIPFFVIQGRDDHVASFEAAKAYVEDVRAPTKAFIPIDGGHFACFTSAGQFVAALRKYVRPLAT